jgi:hypothetical protein
MRDNKRPVASLFDKGLGKHCGVCVECRCGDHVELLTQLNKCPLRFNVVDLTVPPK